MVGGVATNNCLEGLVLRVELLLVAACQARDYHRGCLWVHALVPTGGMVDDREDHAALAA
jgi:hypothetical protein